MLHNNEDKNFLYDLFYDQTRAILIVRVVNEEAHCFCCRIISVQHPPPLSSYHGLCGSLPLLFLLLFLPSVSHEPADGRG
jgi:hypothetical protein